MVELIISAIIFLIVYLIGLSTKTNNKKSLKKFKAYLKTLDSFELDLDTIKVDGFNWSETVPVNIYDTELNPNSDTFYQRSDYGSYSDKYHKDKRTTKFSTKIIIPLSYNNTSLKYQDTLPIENTIIKMKFYMHKKCTVYIENIDETKEKYNFIIDFNILDIEGISYINTSNVRLVNPL